MEKLLKNKIMILDDDENVVLPIEMSLQQRGLETISFNDGEEALEYLKNNKVGVILLDYHMEPHINGDEFIKRFREFNSETIIYLQTAYSEELPAIDMLERYQIQGYIDKGKRTEERMQLIISALKQAQVLELVKEQQKEIAARIYKEEFLSKFLGILMGEIKEKSFGIIGCVNGISEYENDILEEKEQFNLFVENIKKSIKDLNELIEALDLNKGSITRSELKNSLKKLFDILCKYKNVELNIEVTDQYKIIGEGAETVIYILTDVIKYLIDKEEKEININIDTLENKTIITINNEIIDGNILDKIYKLSALDENVVVHKENKLSIEC